MHGELCALLASEATLEFGLEHVGVRGNLTYSASLSIPTNIIRVYNVLTKAALNLFKETRLFTKVQNFNIRKYTSLQLINALDTTNSDP